MGHLKFMVGLRRGLYKAEDIDDHVDAWHASTSEESLPSYLGMTYEEYSAWVEQRVTLSALKDNMHGPVLQPRPSLCIRVLAWLMTKLLPGP